MPETLPPCAHVDDAKLHDILAEWIRENYAPAKDWPAFKIMRLRRYRAVDGSQSCYVLDLERASDA